MASFLLTLFLVTSVLSQSPTLLGSCLKSYGFVIAKSKPSRAASDFQFPFEKIEKEESAEDDKSILTSIISDCALFTISESQEYSFYTDPKFFGYSIQTPLYLSNRTLLI